MSALLNLIHFNDVYHVTPQRIPGTSSTIDVTQFAALLNTLRNRWPEGQGLVLFSGDVFSPSTESSVTRGSHMVPVMNQLMPDISLTGNHEFDFGYPHLTKLMEACKFPWILSNIIDTETGGPPQGLERFKVFERSGLRIGMVGLVEPDWIATVGSWPPNFKYQPMEDVGVELSKLLRDPTGEYRCDLVLALTHSRIPNDITLAKQLGALPNGGGASQHGVDMIFGGHDHMYYVGRGIQDWKNYDFKSNELGTEEDDGLLLVKSGTDFRDLSSMELEIIDAPKGCVRKKIVKSVKGIHHLITHEMPASESMKQLLQPLLDDVCHTLKKPACKALTEFDCRSRHVRTEESASGNWFADVARYAYDDALGLKGVGGADGALLCSGSIRGDSVYGPGLISLGDILAILPFKGPMVVVSITGATLWASLESGLSMWPAHEGRFPVLSGFRVEWDSRLPPGKRVLGVWVEKVVDGRKQDGEPVSKGPGGRSYVVVMRDYMTRGNDGYEALRGCEFVGGIDDENGHPMSAIVRRFLLGSSYIKRTERLAAAMAHKAKVERGTLLTGPQLIPSKSTMAKARWVDAGMRVLKHLSAQRHNKKNISNAFKASNTEDMTDVDAYDGERGRSGKGSDVLCGQLKKQDKHWRDDDIIDLVEIAPFIDGRLRNVGKRALDRSSGPM
ncbi:hypothetical protein FRB97_000832 [Tulasnella sp. 331]|nr:hypothetical protein FRB97_000832 [Tulasnella sp. 331]